jgi:hypothetical protein
MHTQEIRCPSGMRGRIRKILAGDTHELLKGEQGDISADQMADLAERVWVETIDPGPYKFTGDRPPFRTDILLGDRSYVLLSARMMTSNPERTVKMQCPGCGRWFPDPFNYGDLEIKEWLDGTAVSDNEWDRKAIEARDQFASGSPCRTEMPDGAVVHWDLLTGKLLMGRIRDFSRQFGGQSLQTEVAARIVVIEGIQTSDLKPEEAREKIFDWVCSLNDDDQDDSGGFWYLWNDIQDKEVGPETDVSKQCPYPDCNNRFGYRTDIMDFIWLPPPTRSGRSRGGTRRTLKSLNGGSG